MERAYGRTFKGQKMKDILRFLKWQWRKFELWQKMFLFSMFILIASTFVDQPLQYYLQLVPVAIFFSTCVKWFIWDRTVESWQKYQAEKASLFETIKTSDQK